MIVALVLTALAFLAAQRSLYPDTAWGLLFREGLLTGFGVSALIAWVSAGFGGY